ncbi:MAG: c-type cytochrome [Pseudomonadota bacterium]
MLAEVSGRLACEGRIGRTDSLPLFAVTGGAGDKSACGIANMIEGVSQVRGRGASLERQCGIMEGHRFALAGIELAGNPAHLRMVSTAVGKSFHLPFEISRIESRQARRASAVSPAVEPMADEAGVVRSCPGAAERDDPAILGEPVKRPRLGHGAATEQRRADKKDVDAHRSATVKRGRMFRFLALAPLLLVVGACKPPPDQRYFMPMASAAQGKAAIERVGCGSCHTIQGIYWPQGKVGPKLDGLANRALIAGRLPNRPDVLASYIRNAPALLPGSSMPAMPVSETEARDIAAYLYQEGEH